VIEILSEIKFNFGTFCHEPLFRQIHNADSAIDLDDVLSNGVEKDEPGIDCLHVFSIPQFKALISLLNGHIRISTTATKASDTWAPSLETPYNISAKVLDIFQARDFVISMNIFKSSFSLHCQNILSEFLDYQKTNLFYFINLTKLQTQEIMKSHI